MLTGTPLDLTSFGVILKGIGLLYWVFVIGALAFVLVKIKGPIVKAFSAGAVLLLFVGPIAWRIVDLKQKEKVYKDKLTAATQVFNEHCKTAGEKITKTVDNVDGVFFMKWRDEHFNQGEQFRLNDPYGHDCSEEECIRGLLRATDFSTVYPEDIPRYSKGFRYVDSIDPRDGQLYRYTGHIKARNEFIVDKKAIDKSDVKYGVTWDDISTREDREKWIAGSSLKVIDLQTKEVIAERIGYMMDIMQGSTAHFRQPWTFAKTTACPAFAGGRGTARETPNSIFKALIPTEGK